MSKLIALYVTLSIALSGAYNTMPSKAWEIAEHRNGLAIVSVDHDGVWLLNPLTNVGDDWIAGFDW